MNAPNVTDVMTHLVVTLRRKDTLKHAAQRLLSNRISGAPVAEDGRLVGIVSEADLLQAYAPRARRPPFVAPAPLTFLLHGERPREVDDVTVDEVMTHDVVSVSPETSVWEAASLIDRFGVRRLPVVDEERFVVGVVTRSDLVRVMARTNEDIAPAV
jgi:CBS domain-containing protein